MRKQWSHINYKIVTDSSIEKLAMISTITEQHTIAKPNIVEPKNQNNTQN